MSDGKSKLISLGEKEGRSKRKRIKSKQVYKKLIHTGSLAATHVY